MPLKPIEAKTEGRVYTVATPAVQKVNMMTGEVATHRDTGEEMRTVDLLEMGHGRADLLRVTVPASGVPQTLTLGASVHPVGLMAVPWARLGDNGQLRDGMAYRAESLESVTSHGRAATPPRTDAQNAANAVKESTK